MTTRGLTVAVSMMRAPSWRARSAALLVENLERVRQLEGVVLLHVLTEKGKGHPFENPHNEKYHAVAKFNPEAHEFKKATANAPSYTSIFARALIKAAEKDEKIVAITAAMPDGTGLSRFMDRFASRCFDVGIAEQHAVTFAAGLAAGGLCLRVGIGFRLAGFGRGFLVSRLGCGRLHFLRFRRGDRSRFDLSNGNAQRGLFADQIRVVNRGQKIADDAGNRRRWNHVDLRPRVSPDEDSREVLDKPLGDLFELQRLLADPALPGGLKIELNGLTQHRAFRLHAVDLLDRLHDRVAEIRVVDAVRHGLRKRQPQFLHQRIIRSLHLRLLLNRSYGSDRIGAGRDPASAITSARNRKDGRFFCQSCLGRRRSELWTKREAFSETRPAA